MRTYTEIQLVQLLNNRKVLVVSHDAGGGEILSSLIRKVRLVDISYVLGGPAKDIFKAKLHDLKVDLLSDDLLRKIDIVVTGTSMSAELERDAIAAAKRMHKHSVSIIDHWVHYRERFVPTSKKDGRSHFESYLPDEIWVSDDYAYETALKAGFPEQKLGRINNYYMADALKNVKKYKDDYEVKSLLYICEPVYEDVKLLYGDGNAWGYNEYDLIEDVIKSMPVLESRFKKVIFRLHPKEDTKKYNEILSGYKGRMEIEMTSFKKTSLEEDCLRADCVVGGESMALVVALILKKKVFSCLPKSANKSCMLPHKEIRHINSLNEVVDFLYNDGGRK